MISQIEKAFDKDAVMKLKQNSIERIDPVSKVLIGLLVLADYQKNVELRYSVPRVPVKQLLLSIYNYRKVKFQSRKFHWSL